MNHILYLAGGNSRRFGENKLLYELEGKPLYRYGLDMLSSLIQTRDDCTLTVVSRYDEVLDGAQACGVRAVYSPESEKGQSYTIRAGLDALDVREGDFVVSVVADQPYLTADTVAKLLDAARPGVVCARVGFGERRGNPARLCPSCARCAATAAAGRCSCGRTACSCRREASGNYMTSTRATACNR